MRPLAGVRGRLEGAAYIRTQTADDVLLRSELFARTAMPFSGRNALYSVAPLMHTNITAVTEHHLVVIFAVGASFFGRELISNPFKKR